MKSFLSYHLFAIDYFYYQIHLILSDLLGFRLDMDLDSETTLSKFAIILQKFHLL